MESSKASSFASAPMSLSTANHREHLISQGKEVYNAAVFLERGRSGYWWKDVCPPYLPCVTVLQRGQDSFGLINLGKIVFRKPSSLLSAYSPCVGFLYFAELWHSGRCHQNTSNSLVEFRADLWQVSVWLPGNGAWHEIRGKKADMPGELICARHGTRHCILGISFMHPNNPARSISLSSFNNGKNWTLSLKYTVPTNVMGNRW